MKDREVTVSHPAIETLEARECFSAMPFPGYVGGVRVAAGDVGGDSQTGVNVALGDGSVRFVSEIIPQAVGFQGGIYVAAGLPTHPYL